MDQRICYSKNLQLFWNILHKTKLNNTLFDKKVIHILRNEY